MTNRRDNDEEDPPPRHAAHGNRRRVGAGLDPDGFGLGAYEARELASAMGGTLTVTSREGAGTRFRVTLPAATALEAAA